MGIDERRDTLGDPQPGTKCGPMFPGSPTLIEDYTFFHNSTMADVDGDDYPEVLVGTGGYYLRAVDACGNEAEGFPKFTGQWIIPAPAVGDLDADSREARGREAADGQRDRGERAGERERESDGEQRAAVPLDPGGEAHCSLLAVGGSDSRIFMPSSS